MGRSMRLLCSLLVPAVILTGACSADREAPTAVQPVAIERYDGETLYRGMIFGEGPVAALFPELWEGVDRPTVQSVGSERYGQVRAARSQILSELKKSDPQFLDHFADELQSGSHVRVSRAMDEAGRKLASVVAALGADLSAPVPTDGSETGLCVAVAGPVFVFVAAVAVAAGAYYLNVAMTVNAVYQSDRYWSHSDDAFDPGSSYSLAADRLADMIARRLAPA